MDLRFKITQKESTNMSSLVKQMCALKCRINVDTIKGEISIDGIDDGIVENVIDSINEAFNIDGIDIIPGVEIPETEEPVVTAESLELSKIEFSDEGVENQLNKLQRVIYWAMYSSKAQSRDICQYLMAAGAEIAMKYNPRKVHDFSIGDIVVCNYGNHLNGEISGGYVHSIVCDIDEDGTFYAAPITKAKKEEDIQRYLPFEANIDIDYNDSKYFGGTVLLKKGNYIRPERIQYIIGKARPKFFAKLLAALPDAVHFSHNDYAEKLSEKYGDVDNDDCTLFDETTEIVDAETFDDVLITFSTEETSGEGEAKTLVSDSSNEDKSSDNVKKVSVEEYIEELLADSIANLDKSKTIGELIELFLNNIGFKTNEEIIKQSFAAACNVHKISYETILLVLHNIFPDLKEETIKSTMRKEFNQWLTLYPEAKEKYPKVSFMVLLKIFVKKMTN